MNPQPTKMTMNTEPRNDQLTVTVSKPGAVADRFLEATNAAGVCTEMILKPACTIKIAGRRYVKVEGWTTVAMVHGCIPYIASVEEVAGGIRAAVELRRLSDQSVISRAEGFVGRDEALWFGGMGKKWQNNQEVDVMLPKRSDSAIRSMAQTRGTSKVCRIAFSHVIVLMDAGLETTPAEEVTDVEATEVKEQRDPQPIGGLAKAAAASATGGAASPSGSEAAGAKSAEQLQKDMESAKAKIPPTVPRDEVVALREQFRDHKWEKVVIHFGKKKGMTLGQLAESNSLSWWFTEWQPAPYGAQKTISPDDVALRAALDVASEELSS